MHIMAPERRNMPFFVTSSVGNTGEEDQNIQYSNTEKCLKIVLVLEQQVLLGIDVGCVLIAFFM